MGTSGRVAQSGTITNSLWRLRGWGTLSSCGDDDGEPPASCNCLHVPIFIVFFIDTNGTEALCLLLVITVLVKMLSIPTKWFIKINSN